MSHKEGKMKFWEIEAECAKPYEEKKKYSESLVKLWVKRFMDSSVVACSFGKDSTVVLYMALKINPNVKVLFCNTGIEYPSTLRLRDQLVKEWNLNYTEVKPKITFWECLERWGLPSQSRWKS